MAKGEKRKSPVDELLKNDILDFFPTNAERGEICVYKCGTPLVESRMNRLSEAGWKLKGIAKWSKTFHYYFKFKPTRVVKEAE